MDRTTILLQAVDKIKEMGYKCYISIYYELQRNNPTYCFITDGINIGYMQSNDFGCGLNFSTVYKPSSKYGTGVDIATDVTIDKITKELIEKTFVIPQHLNKKTIKKYKSWDDFVINSLTGKVCEEIIEL